MKFGRPSPIDKAKTDSKRVKLETIGRSLDEWRGATPDTPVPLIVKLRVLRRYGNRCYLSGRLIGPADKWDVEHVLALALGGENREANLAPAITGAHRVKTDRDIAMKAKADRQARKHFGIKSKPKGRPLTHPKLKRLFSGEVVSR